jgi:hypothetical protein
MELQDSNEDEIDDSSIEIYPIEESLAQVIQKLEQIESSPIEKLLEAAMVTSFTDPNYLESGKSSSTVFKCSPAVSRFCKKETITFTEYFKLLTSYVIEHRCVDAQGVITPNAYLQSVFGRIEPCSILKFSCNVFYTKGAN